MVVVGLTVILAVVAPVFHEIAPPVQPVAVKVALSPEQIVASLTEIAGFGVTVTITSVVGLLHWVAVVLRQTTK